MLAMLPERTKSEKIVPIITDHSNSQQDIEVQSTGSQKLKDQIVNQNISIFAWFYTAIVLITIGAMIIPMFMEFERIQNISQSGVFGNALRTSTRLMIMESISIGCTLPMLSDNFLDQVTDKNTKMTLSMWHRVLVMLTFSLLGVLYLSLSDYYFMAYLYILFNRIKVILVGAVTSYAVSSGTVTGSLMSKIYFLIPILICAIRFVFDAYSLVYPENALLNELSTIFFYLLYITFAAVQISWYIILWCRYRVNKTLNDEEKKEAVLMASMLFYIVSSKVMDIIFGGTISWAETGANNLVGYIGVQIVCILLVTVLPTRFMRKVVQVRRTNATEY